MFRTGHVKSEYCRHFFSIVTSWLRKLVGVTDIVRLQRTNNEASRSRIVSLCCVGVCKVFRGVVDRNTLGGIAHSKHPH